MEQVIFTKKCIRCGATIQECERACPDCDEYLFDEE